MYLRPCVRYIIIYTDQEEESFSGFEPVDSASVSGLVEPNNMAKKGCNDSHRGPDITKQKPSEKEIVDKGPGKCPGMNTKKQGTIEREKSKCSY